LPSSQRRSEILDEYFRELEAALARGYPESYELYYRSVLLQRAIARVRATYELTYGQNFGDAKLRRGYANTIKQIRNVGKRSEQRPASLAPLVTQSAEALGRTEPWADVLRKLRALRAQCKVR
jgi:hypothetical protein